MKTVHKLDAIIDTLDDLLLVALNPLRYEELVAHERKLIQIVSRTELILSFIDSHEVTK